MRLTSAEFREIQSRIDRNRGHCIASPAAERESDLHEQIIDECRRRQWVVFHGSMAHRTFRTEGEPDFVILCDSGKFLMVEAKTAKGKLSPAQSAIAAWARKLGHQIHVVRSISEFQTLTCDNNSRPEKNTPPKV